MPEERETSQIPPDREPAKKRRRKPAARGGEDGLERGGEESLERAGEESLERADENDLERAAVLHLERYSSSIANLRQVLRRRVRRSCAHPADDPHPADPLIEEVIERLCRAGTLDDRAYGAGLIRRGRARGRSTRRIAATLLAKGIAPELCDELLSRASEEDPELAAARVYARRRRLGPHRPEPQRRAERRERDLAALARAGYSLDVAEQVIDAAPDGERRE